MISTCTLFFMVSMTQHFKFVLSHYINVLLILYNSCCQNKIMSVSVSIYIFVLHLSNCIEYTINPNLMIEICTKTSSISLFTLCGETAITMDANADVLNLDAISDVLIFDVISDVRNLDALSSYRLSMEYYCP